MQKIGRLPPIKMDDFCFRAVRQRNSAVVEMNEKTSPTMGGNVIVYQQLGGPAAITFEYTHFKYELATAEQFVALQLILDYGRNKKSAIIDREVNGMGVSVL